MRPDARKTLAVLSQVYVPDPTSVGQHMHDAAAAMARRGWRVLALTSDRGYEDPGVRYPAREVLDGVEIVRLPWSSFGKGSLGSRVVGGSVFLAQATLRALAVRRIDQVLVTTSPPMGGAAGVVLRRLRGVPVTYWVMDLNPDQVVATGAMAPDALPVRAFDWLNLQVLSSARRVVALDNYMARRIEAKTSVSERLTVAPPWPHVETTDPILDHRDNPFRAELGLGDDDRVVMYSGNLSPSHPIDTILEAARRLRDHARLRFVFIGGGLGMKQVREHVERHALPNVLTLPYQPLAKLRYSLSAADVHLVSMGEAMVGVVHPCKVYGAMAVGRPILALGPRDCHVADIVLGHGIGWQVAHGAVDDATRVLRELAEMSRERLAEMGRAAREVGDRDYSRAKLLGRFCDLLEAAA